MATAAEMRCMSLDTAAAAVHLLGLQQLEIEILLQPKSESKLASPALCRTAICVMNEGVLYC